MLNIYHLNLMISLRSIEPAGFRLHNNNNNNNNNIQYLYSAL